MPGPRVFTVDEANAFIPELEAAFEKMDGLRNEIREAKIKLTALEMIWGRSVAKDDCPDYQEGQSLLEAMRSLEEDFQGVITEVGEKGAQVKDLEMGLIDLYHVRESILVHLCWKRGEAAFEAWHHVDEGYSSREAL